MNQNPKFSRQKSGCASGAKILQTKVGMRLWRKNSKSRNSITLTELLIAISLLTLILLAGSGIYLSGWNMFRQAQVIAQAQRNALIPMAHIVKILQQGASQCADTNNHHTLTFRTYSNGSGLPDPSQTSQYIFSIPSGQTTGSITYDKNTSDTVAAITIGQRIQDCQFTTSHSGTLVNVIIQATDNNGQNPYSLESKINIRYSGVPPIY